MPVVNMLAAKTNLSKLVQQVESGEEAEIVIARNGKPAARIVAVGSQGLARPNRRLGMLKGKIQTYSQEEFDALNAQVWGEALDKPL